MQKVKMPPYSAKAPSEAEEGRVIRGIINMYTKSGLYDEREPGPADAIRGALFFYARHHGLKFDRDKISDIDRLRLWASEMNDMPGEPLPASLDGREWKNAMPRIEAQTTEK